MKIITYPDGRSEQVGTPLELAQFMFGLTEYQTMQKFKNLIDSISQQIESQQIEPQQIESQNKKRASKKKVGESNAN
jgi:hypothetical protein